MRFAWADRLRGFPPALGRASAYLASALMAAAFLSHLARGSKAYLGLLEDDYFYYAVVADHLVALGRPTFDGVTPTNGVHPLWFAVIVALRAVFGRFGPGFYAALTVVSLAAMLATFELGRRLAERLGASPRVAVVAAALYSAGTAQLLTSGMESVLAVPLFLWLLVEAARPLPLTPRRAAALGFIASLAVLARLDLALAAALLFVGLAALLRPPVAAYPRLVLGLCAGGALLPLYAAANHVLFGSPFPVSALAKQLQTAPGFNVTYAKRVALGTVYGPTIGVVLPLGLVAWLLLTVRGGGHERRLGRFVGGVALVFAFVFFALNARTGWTFFGWYAYPLAPATIAAVVFAYQRWGRPLRDHAAAGVLAVALLALPPALALRYFVDHGPRWSIADNSMVAMSYDLAERVRGRDGRFAMGAIGGIATYVLDKPVFQLEGIVSDHKLVGHIRRQDPLDAVLREYGVDYLIVSVQAGGLPTRDGCYIVTQPHPDWAGHRSAKMRGAICSEPIERFVTPRGPNPWSRFGELETLVWDLRAARWSRL